MVVTELGISKLTMLEQFLNALSPMEVTELGMEMLGRVLQYQKAS